MTTNHDTTDTDDDPCEHDPSEWHTIGTTDQPDADDPTGTTTVYRLQCSKCGHEWDHPTPADSGDFDHEFPSVPSRSAAAAIEHGGAGATPDDLPGRFETSEADDMTLTLECELCGETGSPSEMLLFHDCTEDDQ